MVQIAEGSYTSDGLARNVTSPGWAADFVIVKGGANRGVFWTKDMPAASLKGATGAIVLQNADGITQHASGFTVAADNAGAATRINVSGTVYHWIAFRDNAATDFSVYSFTGNATAETKATGSTLSGTPNAAFLLPGSTANARAVYWAASTMTAANSKQLASSAGTGFITGLVSGGISVSTSASVNASGETYYVVVMKDVAGLIKLLTYTSQASGFTVSGAGFAPGTIFGNVENAASEAYFRGSAQTGDNAYGMAATNTASGRITAKTADGFTVGTSALTNDTAVARPYHALAFLSGTSSAPAGGAGNQRLLMMGVG